MGLVTSLDTLGRAAGERSALALELTQPLDWSKEALTLRVTMDWLERSNASYLEAGLAIVPDEELVDPLAAPNALTLSYIGVPPQALARRSVELRSGGAALWRDEDGWPERGASGRQLERVKFELVISDDAVAWREGLGKVTLQKGGLGFTRGRLVLFISSQSNASKRAVRWRSLEVLRGSDL